MDDFEKRFAAREDRKKRIKKAQPGEDDAPLPDPVEPIHATTEPKRNEPCSCGSGKKYKKCCGKMK